MSSLDLVVASTEPNRSSPKRQAGRPLLQRRVPAAALAAFTRSLAVMVAARLPLVEALETAAEQSPSASLTEAGRRVARAVRQGSTLADALAEQPAVFDPLFIQFVRTGEFSGTLDRLLLRVADHLERAATLTRKLRLALAYPAVVLAVAVAAVVFLLTVIVPTFAEMFISFGEELPTPTRIVIALSRGLVTAAPFLLLGGIASVVVGRRALRFPSVKRGWDHLLLRLPVLGALRLKGLIARFAQTLGTLLGAGVGLVPALDILADAIPNTRLQETVRVMRHSVVHGRGLARSLQADEFFPPLLTHLVFVGEETAELDEMLLHVADHYEREVDASVDALTTLLEPLLIVTIGLVLGAILIALYLPMFDLVQAVQ